MSNEVDNEALPQVLTNSPGFLLSQIARILSGLVAEALVPVGLAPPEYGLLKIISVQGPLMQQEFADKFQIDRTTVTSIVDGLEDRDLVIRQRSPKDRRKNLLHLTPTGHRLLTRAIRLVNKAQKKFLEPLDESEWEVVRDCLVKLLVAQSRKDRS